MVEKQEISCDGMEQLVPLIIKLQNAFSTIKTNNQIELPQLVVVGSQSSGKSSVLESIVGRDFLPRGSGIVTRCPLVLSLRQAQGKEYGEFQSKKGQKFENFDQIRKEIELETDRLAGTNKGVSDQQINLTIYSPNVVDLTLVDLPGITKVPVKGQAQDIEQQIKKLILKYIRPQNSLILALTAANTDLANSDALQIARVVDPQGDRTIGVVTKIDLMDEGTDAIELLQGKDYPLKLGYFGVKCRSQKSIDERVPIREALMQEHQYFSRHPIYSSQSQKMGVPYLTRCLNKILIQHIQKCIPNLSKQIMGTIQLKERELFQYDSEYRLLDKANQGPFILNMIGKYVESYTSKLEGSFVREIATECIGGARINYIFHKIFRNIIMQVNPFEYLSEQDIQTAIKNASAMTPSLFVPEGAFEVLIKQQIARLLEPSLQCCQLVYEELRRLMLQIQLPELQRYYKLQSRIHDVMEGVLNNCLIPTNEMILNLIEIETSLINSNHPDFIGSADSLLNLFQDTSDNNLMQRESNNRPQQSQQVKSQEVLKQPVIKEEQQSSRSWMPSFFSKSQPVQQEEKKVVDQEPEIVPEQPQKFNYAVTKIDNHGNLPEVILAEVPLKLRSHPNQDSSRVIMETRVIQNLIQSYFGIVKKTAADMVPKTIMSFLVNESKKLAKSELVVKVYQAEDLSELLVEDPIVVQNRENCKQMISALRTAQTLLSEVTQFRL